MLDGGTFVFQLIRETRPVKMVAENHILAPEWKHAGPGGEEEGCSLLAGWNSGRKETAGSRLPTDCFFPDRDSLSGVDSSWKTAQTLTGG